MLYEPGPNHSLSSYSGTKNHLLLNIMKDVRTEVRVMTWQSGQDGGKWSVEDLPAPGLGTYGAAAFDDDLDDRYWFDVDDFIRARAPRAGRPRHRQAGVLKSAPSFFDAEGLETRQFFAASKDGTRIPYFQVSRKDLARGRQQPGVLTGYGGFEVPLLPGYDPQRGGGLAGAGWGVRGGQHPRRRRVRPGLAPGGPQAQPAAGATRTSSPWPRT